MKKLISMVSAVAFIALSTLSANAFSVIQVSPGFGTPVVDGQVFDFNLPSELSFSLGGLTSGEAGMFTIGIKNVGSDVIALAASDFTPDLSFVSATAEWVGGLGGSLSGVGDLNLRQEILAGATEFFKLTFVNGTSTTSQIGFAFSVVPLPVPLGLLLAGIAGMGIIARRRRNVAEVA